ncbi:MASE1 domain-containing protein [Archangium violaceum]|uniref:MASE1 domain-containing protein n=1 Tax=Archangium violaceum TaxID=83451 RepID=UPI00193B917A|nr:MASE1 domain-containing protein [Archangium violaceum]QRK11574.1 MASE1 domain-containing protein [Archangium violaceum]
MPEPKHILQRWHPLGRLGLFALVYGASAWLGNHIVRQGELVSAMWPASGVAVTALLLSRFRYWPALALTVFLLEPFACLPGRLPPPTYFFISAGNTLEALLGAFLLRRYAGFRPSLERVRNVLALLGLSAMLSTLVNATSSVTLLAALGRFAWTEWWRQLRIFWVGDAMGVLLVTPVLLTWISRGLEGWSRARRWELVALLVTLAATVLLAFRWAPATSVYHPVSYVALPFILWAALRFEARGTAAAMLTLALVAVSQTLAGRGPFVLGPEGNTAPTTSLVFLQSFLASVCVSGLMLAAALGERRHAQEKAIHLNRELRQSLEELATAQQELVRRERMAALGELSASIAHEVRNPLGVIANSVAALTRMAVPERDGTAWELLGVMGEEVARLDHLVNGLLDFARPLEPRLFTQSLGSVVEGALEASLRAEPDARRSVQVTRALDQELPEAPLDAQLLHLALSNLFTNALQAMPHGGSLRVELGRDEPRGVTPQARLSITDTGSGIVPEVMARMFEPFYTTKAAGTGLGLAIVRRIVEAHHGHVEVHSTPGQGTTFTVLLPLAQPRSASAA